MTLLPPYLLLLITSTLSTPGRRPDWHGRLSTNVNATLTASCGVSTSARDNPWAAILYWDNVFLCGATLLESQLAVTAAHCVIGKRTDFFVLYYGTTFQPDSGILDQGAFNFGGDTKIDEIRIHPNYDTANKFEGFDVAVLKLRERITFNEIVKPIRVIPTQAKYDDLLKKGAYVKMGGFGQISGPIDSFDIDDYPDQMQLIQQRIVPQQRCNRGNTTVRFGPPRDVLCTRGLCGKPQPVKTFQQVCPGDSGSGIIGYFQEENRYYLLGIASYILSPSNLECGKSTKPAFSISTRFHRDFIYEDFSSTTQASTTTAASPVNCRWGSWTEWSQCTQTCGGGFRVRFRDREVEASNGGRTCRGTNTEEEDCNTITCGSLPPSTSPPVKLPSKSSKSGSFTNCIEGKFYCGGKCLPTFGYTRDVNGNRPYGETFADRYWDCNRACLNDSEMCNQQCREDRYPCQGKCYREQRFPCGEDCLPTLSYTRDVDKTRPYGETFGDSYWDCNGDCLNDSVMCDQKCREDRYPCLGKCYREHRFPCGADCLPTLSYTRDADKTRPYGETFVDSYWECNGVCLNDSVMCDQQCRENRYPCLGKCYREHRFPCGADCLPTLSYTRDADKTRPYGETFADSYWDCNGVCLNDSVMCDQQCRENRYPCQGKCYREHRFPCGEDCLPTHGYTRDVDKTRPYGETFSSRYWECNGKCITDDEPCNS